jgi:hypothetical protein
MDLYKEIIINEIMFLSIEDKIEILKIVNRADPSQIYKCSDGTRIRLNNLSDDVIKNIYTFVKHKLNLS